MSDLYSLDTAARLFEKLVRDMTQFVDSPSEDGLFNVLFPLNHLRDWVCPGKYESYKSKPEHARTAEEKLHAELNDMPEYKIVRELCNRAKHYNIGELPVRTAQIRGLRAGLGRAGDSLDVSHFLVDGREIREVFWAVYSVYFAHFRARA